MMFKGANMVVAENRPERSHEHTMRVDPGYVAFWLLRAGFVVLPVLVGVDKYFDWMVDWRQYLWSGVPNTLHISATSFMHIAGVIEIVAGIVVLIAPQVGGALVVAWLAGIATNLVLVGIDQHTYRDVALRDFVLMIGALALVFARHAVSTNRRKAQQSSARSARSLTVATTPRRTRSEVSRVWCRHRGAPTPTKTQARISEGAPRIRRQRHLLTPIRRARGRSDHHHRRQQPHRRQPVRAAPRNRR